MSEIDGRKVIFITGAASGMGRETSRLFAKQGWFVGACDVNEAGLAALQDELGASSVWTHTLDVSDSAAYQAVLKSFSQKSDGRLDVLFNNAGIGRGGPFDQMPFEDVVAVVNVNFMGVLIGIHAAAPMLKATPNSLCFTTSSSSALFGMPGIAVYSATKHAVRGLTEALSVEFAAYGVRVADALPGLIDTPILPEGATSLAPKSGMFRLIPPVEIAEAVWAAYHEDPNAKGTLHWYIPPELKALDKAATASPEELRDRMKATGGMFFLSDPDLSGLE